MLVYGDIERIENSEDLAAEIGERLSACQTAAPGLARHQALVGAFIRTAELLQAVADAEFAEHGKDEKSEGQCAGETLLIHLAVAVMQSWDSAFCHMPPLPFAWRAQLGMLADGKGPVRAKQAEGFSFYALYPEAYGIAARRSGLGPDTTVIGIRSIGTGLAAMVAAALGTRSFHTVRPVGHPFRRELALSSDFGKELLRGTGPYAIVDEGPGFSGSSFNSVADWLVAHGVAEDRLHVFPSHHGSLGDVASPGHRERWLRIAGHIADFEGLVLHPPRPEHRLETWITSLVGALDGPLKDISAGRWRGLGKGATYVHAPIDAVAERRKYLAETKSGRWLAKYVGLGKCGDDHLHLAQRLADAGFAPQPAGLCHGFVVTRWTEAEPTEETAPPLARVLDYLAFRASLPPDRPGASLQQLFEMTAANIGEHLGAAIETKVRTALGSPYQCSSTPCRTDNRMQLWEWLHGPTGWLKLDATDHHAAHDMVGCQDIAWDLVGAAVELDWTKSAYAYAVRLLAERLERPFDRQFLERIELCYLGFEIGYWSMALKRADPDEHRAISAQLDRYKQRPALQRLLTCG
jgi:hypothetical protein